MIHAIDAALTTLAKVDLAGLAVMDVLELAARCEKAHRQNDVVRYDLSHELHRRDVSEVGGKPGRVLAIGCESPRLKPNAAPRSPTR